MKNARSLEPFSLGTVIGKPFRLFDVTIEIIQGKSHLGYNSKKKWPYPRVTSHFPGVKSSSVTLAIVIVISFWVGKIHSVTDPVFRNAATFRQQPASLHQGESHRETIEFKYIYLNCLSIPTMDNVFNFNKIRILSKGTKTRQHFTN